MITLVLGGTRSGKSAIAEALVTRRVERARLAGRTPAVTYVATAVADGDDDLLARVAAHRSRRPSEWRTVEAGDALAQCLHDLAEVSAPGDQCLLDALGTWVAAHPELDPDVGRLADALVALRVAGVDVVVVSEEVGLGVHAVTEVGRRFTDVLGTVNQAVAALADTAWLVVAGRLVALASADELA